MLQSMCSRIKHILSFQWRKDLQKEMEEEDKGRQRHLKVQQMENELQERNMAAHKEKKFSKSQNKANTVAP